MSPPFLATARGLVAELMRSLDWSRSPLGPPERWPASLQVVTGLALHAQTPMYIAWGPQRALLYNDAYLAILGDKHPAALGQPAERVWAEIWDYLRPLYERTFAGEAVHGEDVAVRIVRHGFEEDAWFTFSHSPLFDGGEVGGLVCHVTETTQAVQARQRQREERRQLQQWFEQAPSMVVVLAGPDHVIEVANRAYRELVGERPLIGLPARQALPELEAQGFFELLDRTYASGEPYVGRASRSMVQRSPGAALEERFFDFVYQPMRQEDGRVSGIFVQGVDVTEATRAEERMREAQERLRAAQEGMQLAMTIADAATWDWDMREERLLWSRSHFELLGHPAPPDGVAPLSLWQNSVAIEDVPRLQAEFQRAMRERDLFRSEHRRRRADGSTIWVSAAGRFFYDEQGEPVRFTGVFFDITERKGAEQALRDADRRKDEFLATLAHELRNPLAPIRNGLAILRMPALEEPTRERMLGLMDRQVRHVVRLVDDLLEVSRITRGKIELRRETLDLRGVVQASVDAAQPQLQGAGHELRVTLPSQPVLVDADPTRIAQVVDNLLNNAIKYTPEGGRIHIELAARAGQAELAVQDNGTGIPAEMLERVFELFTQVDRTLGRAKGGLGIGLALVRQLVHMHGGQVEVHSDGIGAGARFLVRLPLLGRARPEPAPAPSAALQASREQVRVLIVDDNHDAADSLALVLDACGHSVRAAYSGPEALAAMPQFRPQWVLLDIGMPGMDGHEVARRLRAMPGGGELKLAAVTGWGQEDDRRLTQQSGFDAHLVKPVEPAALLELLASR